MVAVGSLMLGWLGYIFIVLGGISIVIGLVLGAKDVFKKVNQGAAQYALPDKFFDVLLKLFDAKPPVFFCIFGVLITILGLVMNGIQVFGGEGCQSVGAHLVESLPSLL